MKTCIIFANLLALTAAFAPNQKAHTSVAALSSTTKDVAIEAPFKVEDVEETPAAARTENKYANEIGTQAPLGFFDPLGVLSSENDMQFQWWREAEIKHGRISMLAVVGYITTYAGYRIPGCEDIPFGFEVFDKGFWPTGSLAATNLYWTFSTILILETAIMKDAYDMAEHPGDYRNGVGKGRWDFRSEEYKIDQRAKELNNGRAAMMGMFGIAVHESMGNIDEILGQFKPVATAAIDSVN